MEENGSRLVLEAKGSTKVFPGTTALQDVDLKIYSGRINALVGENGAGKSTLMKIIAGIERPTSGSILLYGEDGTPEEISFSSTRDAAKR